MNATTITVGEAGDLRNAFEREGDWTMIDALDDAMNAVGDWPPADDAIALEGDLARAARRFFA